MQRGGNGQSDLIVNFPGHGVWTFRNNTTWTQLDPHEAVAIAAAQLDAGTQVDLVIDFGPGVGLHTYTNSSTWALLNSLTAQGLVVADLVQRRRAREWRVSVATRS